MVGSITYVHRLPNMALKPLAANVPPRRMKDYYDIYHLLTSFKYDNTILQDAINRTFENRHTLYNADTMFFRKDFPNHTQMQLRWSTFLKKATIKNSLSSGCFGQLSL